MVIAITDQKCKFHTNIYEIHFLYLAVFLEEVGGFAVEGEWKVSVLISRLHPLHLQFVQLVSSPSFEIDSGRVGPGSGESF